VADPNALVIDPLGRANGVKDGKTVIQTPGAKVTLVNGQIVVAMPDLPDGEVTTHFTNPSAPDRDVDVITKVEERGKPAVEVIDTVKPVSTTVTGVEVKKSAADAAPTVQLRKPADAKATTAAETPHPPSEEPKRTADATPRSVEPNGSGTAGSSGPTGQPSLGGAASAIQTPSETTKSKDEKKSAAPTSGFIPPVTLPTIPVPVNDPGKKPADSGGSSGSGGNPNGGANTNPGGAGSSNGGSTNGGNGFKPDTK